MRVVFWLPLWAALIATNVSASMVEYWSTDLNTNLYDCAYFLSGMTLQVDQQLDVRFDPTLYGTLSNPQVPVGFITLLLQPNNPPGTFGDFEVTPLTDNLSLVGPFSVDVVSLGNDPGGSQPYFINQFDANGNFLYTVDAGFTVYAGDTPEPAVFALVGIALLAGGAWRHIRKRAVIVRAGH